MFPACYGLAMTRYALTFGRMIVVERGLNILGVQLAKRPAQPGFRRRTDGPYTWISFLKAFILSNPRAAATFTVLRATAQRNSDDDLENGPSVAHIVGMSESGHRSCKCGAVYDRSEHIAEAREISGFECAVCGATIENWNSAWVPRYRFIACPARDAE
jgi:hypothetical protein